MNENLDPDSTESTALTLQEHAMQEIDAVAAGIADLAKRYTGVVYDVATTKGMADARAARKEIREPRYEVERVRKAKIAELRQISSNINERAATITEDIRALEEPIDQQIKGEEERKAAEKAAEQERIAKQEAKLDSLRRAPLNFVGADSDALQAGIADLKGDDLAELDDVYRPEAEKARDDSVAALEKMLDERRKLDEAAAELERQRQEQAAREAAEAEARRQQQEKEDADRRARQEAEDAERRAKQEQEDRERAEARAAEESRLAEERRQLEEREAAQREAEAKAEQERREAAEKAEAERKKREQVEAEERARSQQEAEEAAVREATILTAAGEAVAYLQRQGDPEADLIAKKLLAALDREAKS